MPPFLVSCIKNDMDALDLQQAVLRSAQIHADEWKQASRTNAEITHEMISAGMREALSTEEARNLAEDTLRYMRRYL
jgi:hypothetical protein